MLLEGRIHGGETVKITTGKDGLMFNGAAAGKREAAKTRVSVRPIV
jgi:hypothetical protein